MPRVLVIDDHVLVRAAITVALQSEGFEVIGVEDKRTGLKTFQASHFDIVIADIYMPGMDGAKLIKELRERVPDLSIVAMSGVLFKWSGQAVLDFLALAPNFANVVFLQKPFRPPQLVRAVQNAMSLNAETKVPA